MDNDTSAQAMERKEKPLNELLTSSMVSIYVGQENTHWYIHERLLCYYSPFFADIFYTDDKSGEKTKAQKNKAYGLEDEDDLAFEMLVGWLYSRQMKVPTEEKDVGPLLDLYLLSERLGIDKLSADIVEAVSHFYYQSHSYPSLRRVQHIYANTNEDNEMREMMVGAIAKLLTTSEKIPAHWASALQRNGQLAVDIIRSIQQWKIEEKTIPDARDRSSSRGRSAKNGFSAIDRAGDSMETEKTGTASNMGVESLNSDGDQDQSMGDSQFLKSEDSEASSKPNFATPPPNYSAMSSSNLSSSEFTTPMLETDKFLTDTSATSIPRPKKPPDTPKSPSLITSSSIKRRRLSVTFANETRYNDSSNKHTSSGATTNHKESKFSAYIFFPPPLATASAPAPVSGGARIALTPTSPRSYAASLEDLGLQPLSLTMSLPMLETKAQIEGRGQLQRSKSDDQVVRKSLTGLVRDKKSANARLRLLQLAMKKPETLMLGFLWMMYLGWMARV